MIRDTTAVVDVGTDHAILPAYLALNRDCKSIIATDINEQPLRRAARTVYEYGVDDKVDLRLCDGLDGINSGEADEIVIAGLGGETISEIIEAAEWLKDGGKNLILQPMSRPEMLRDYLSGAGFSIEREEPVRDGKHLYTVIKASYVGPLEVPAHYKYIGEVLSSESELAAEYVDNVISSFGKMLAGMKKSRTAVESKLRELENILTLIEKERAQLCIK